jgi:hypothetical protein
MCLSLAFANAENEGVEEEEEKEEEEEEEEEEDGDKDSNVVLSVGGSSELCPNTSSCSVASPAARLAAAMIMLTSVCVGT